MQGSTYCAAHHGPRTSVPSNAKLIQGAGTTGKRNTYQFIDKTAKPDVAYYYRIEDIDFAGQRAIHATYRLRGVIAPVRKHITTWGTLKIGNTHGGV